MRDITSTGQCSGCGAFPDEKHDSNCIQCDHNWVANSDYVQCSRCGSLVKAETSAEDRAGEVREQDYHRKTDPTREERDARNAGVDVVPPRYIVTSIPPEVEQYADDIRRFVDAMVFKLGQKSHKGRWEELPIGKAMALMEGEVKELTEAIERGNLVEVLLESADVANFALIVASIAIERGK